MKTAIIVGGGLAGLVAARRLAMSGSYLSLIFESSSISGGKAASWRDETGALIEAGLHVCFPYHRHLLSLLGELGAGSGIKWADAALRYVRTDGDVAELRFPRLPRPLNGAFAIARHRHLSLCDRLSALFGAVEATLSSHGWRSRYESITFAQWAQRRGLSKALVASVFEPMIGGLTFLRSDEVSARAMLDYIVAVGGSTDAYRVGQFRGGTAQVVIEPLVADLVARGGRIRTGCAVDSLVIDGGRATGVRLQDGNQVRADVVIVAVPSHQLGRLMPAALQHNPAIRSVARLQAVPVASVLVRFDRLLGGPPGLRLSPGCVFNTWADMAELLPELAGSGRSVLQLVVAPLRCPSLLDDAALTARVIADVRRILPAARAARVEKTVVTRTPHSVHAAIPGAEQLRPDVHIGVPGLLLAGDHVCTGHNPNMESAVISGLRAANLAIEAAR
ncbi:MAG: FAD-dependent oxidoreductase [Rubrivivax sp.]|nr:FAD-dependent oxidoreductase [Rubrivivax sp.]